MSLSPMSHVKFKKRLCRSVDFRGQGPYKVYIGAALSLAGIPVISVDVQVGLTPDVGRRGKLLIRN